MNGMVQTASFSVVLISWLWSHDRLCVFKLRARVIAWQQRLRSRGSTCAGKKKRKSRGSVFLTSSLHYLQFGSESSFVHKAFVTRVCARDETQPSCYSHTAHERRRSYCFVLDWGFHGKGRLLYLIILLKKYRSAPQLCLMSVRIWKRSKMRETNDNREESMFNWGQQKLDAFSICQWWQRSLHRCKKYTSLCRKHVCS